MPSDRSSTPPYRGVLVSHTHWDRAWYLPFETFRHRLVRLVDRVLDLLDQAPRFQAFMLDGQTVLLDDYLEIKPGRRADLERHVRAGRLQIGPWYTAPDLFLASGEALVRNLQIGLARCAQFGGAMPVGYAPDPFGHPAQMPQLLQGVGIETYLFTRGLGAAAKARHGSVFDWRAPDGSTVLAHYLHDGYFNAGALGHAHVYGRFDGDAPNVDLAVNQIEESVERIAPLQPGRTLLFLNGFDHMPEQAALPELIEAVNTGQGRVRLEHGTLADFFQALAEETPERGTVEGDLLGNADHPILKSVYSARLYLKQQNHRAEHLLRGCAEPLAAALHLAGHGPDARPFLRHAWETLLQNHPHDDLCGCSVDAVHDDDETRFRHVEEGAGGVLVEVLETLRTRGFQPPAHRDEPATDVFVFNPHPWPQRARVRARLYLPNPGGEHGEPRPASRLSGVDGEGRAVAVAVLATDAPAMRNHYLEQTWSRRYDVQFEADVPALGYTLVRLFEDGPPAPDEPDARDAPPALETDRYRLDAADGRLRLAEQPTGRTLDDLVGFEYERDGGDTYSFSPVLGDAPRKARFLDAAQAAPGTLRAHFLLDVPAALDDDTLVALPITADLRLGPHGGVEIDVRYENTAKDGRLRIVVPLGFATERLLADGHFRLAERRRPDPIRTPESDPARYAAYPGELDYATHHQGDFVLAEDEGAGLRTWIANRGLPEVELMGGGTHVAITLHRAVGWLSVEGGRIRRCGAGPHVETPGAQCLRPVRAQLAVGLGPGSRGEAVRSARAFARPVWVRELPYLPYLPPLGPEPRARSLLAIDNPAVELSSLRPEDAGPGLVARLWNRTGAAQTATLRLGVPAARWCRTGLLDVWDGRASQPVAGGALTLTLAPHRIETVVVRA